MGRTKSGSDGERRESDDNKAIQFKWRLRGTQFASVGWRRFRASWAILGYWGSRLCSSPHLPSTPSPISPTMEVVAKAQDAFRSFSVS